MRKLCFTTTNGDKYRGEPASADGQMESMAGVLTMGHKSNRYLQYQIKEVPPMGREFCKYSFDYSKKPMYDTVYNAQVKDRLREVGTSGSIVTADLPSTT